MANMVSTLACATVSSTNGTALPVCENEEEKKTEKRNESNAKNDQKGKVVEVVVVHTHTNKIHRSYKMKWQ